MKRLLWLVLLGVFAAVAVPTLVQASDNNRIDQAQAPAAHKHKRHHRHHKNHHKNHLAHDSYPQ